MNRSSTRRTMAQTPTLSTQFVVEVDGEEIHRGYDYSAARVAKHDAARKGGRVTFHSEAADLSPR